MNKKAQVGALIGIITLLFIFYILFLPPAEREALLADEEITELPPGAPGSNVLLLAPVGSLEFVGARERDHYLPNIYLQEGREAQILTTLSPFTISKGLYGDAFKEITFPVADPANTGNVMLSFQTPVHKGTLVISINGFQIFEGSITVQNPAPVSIRPEYLRQQNTLKFEVQGFGIPTKTYEFRDIKVIGDVTDVRKQRALETIPISEEEYNNFESAFLDFYPLCSQATVGAMEITLNDEIIFSGVPACESLNRQDIFKEDLKLGKNVLTIRASRGSFGVEQLRLKTFLKPSKGFIDYFNVEPRLWDAVQQGAASIVLDIQFVDDRRLKGAQTNINGRLDVIDQREPRFTRDITPVIVEGNNFIEILPLTALNIVKVEVRVE